MSLRRGSSLVEMLLWFTLLGAVFALAYPTFGEALVLHRQAQACAEEVESGLRLFRDLKADLREAGEAGQGPAGALRLALPGGAVLYRQGADAIERQREGGGPVRRYPGLEGLEIRKESLLRIRWSLKPVRKGGNPPRFEVVDAR